MEEPIKLIINELRVDRVKSIFSADMLRSLEENKPLVAVLKFLQLAIVVAVLVFLTNKVSAIGWHDVMAALPTHPLYYVFFLAMFLTVPITEMMAFRIMWGDKTVRPKEHLGAFIRKRVYNYAVLSYSGEAYIALWARKKTQLQNREIVANVKDASVLSSIASNSFTLLMLAIFFVTGQLSVLINADPDYELYLGLAALIGIVVLPLVIKFSDKIIAIDANKAKKVVAIHFARVTLTLLFQALQWAVILPGVPFDTWLLFLTAQLVLTRVPFLPNVDLLYVGLGLSLAGYIDAPDAVIAGMFLASGALFQLTNLIAFILTSFDRAPKDEEVSVEDVANPIITESAHTA
jgi:hypothetical protein